MNVLRGYPPVRIFQTMTPLVLNLKSHRQSAGFTQVELAKAIGVRQATISDLETGKSRRVELDVLERLADVLGVEPAALFQRTGRRRKR